MVTLFSVAVLVVFAILMAVNRSRSGSTERFPVHIRFVELWRWRGAVDRGTYALVGVVGFAVKHNIDRLIATQIFGRRFTPFNYWIPPVDAIRIDRLSTADARFLTTMIAIALPFIWVGLAMTVRRLRSAGLPLWLVVLFFVPIVNLAFFVLMSLVPGRDVRSGSEPRRVSAFSSFIPRDKLGSSAMAVALTGSMGALATYFGVQRLGTYGWGVFVALPFCFGLASVLIYSYHQPRTLQSCIAVALISVGMVALALFALAIEGLICIIMALPIATPLALLGGFVGYLAQRHGSTSAEAPSMMLLMMLVPFGVMTAETLHPAPPPRTSVRTAIRIDAPAAEVWSHLIAFPDVTQPASAVFRLGVSYPMSATISGDGVGAIRECFFSTGTFVEKINIWEEGKRLGFTIASGPEGMRELSPYDIHPRHLHGYFVPESAEFQLTTNADGSTELEGTSWYHNSMWPSPYWRLWSDAVVHQVHMRVFEHIKSLSEVSGEKHKDTKAQRHQDGRR